MKKILSGLFLFLVSGLAFAGNAWDISGGPTPVASHTDLSIAYLAQVFGTVGDSLQGTGGQMLGMLFSKLNEGIMVVAGLWLIYTIITIILRSAMDGSFMGPNKNVFWIVIRIALAFAMLIPGPMTGYNVIQDIVMKVVVEGVSLADQTWNFGLDYISAGGALWRTPEESGGGNSGDKYFNSGLSSAVLSTDAAKNLLKPAQSIFNDEVCMVASSMQNANSNNSSTGNGVVNTGSAGVIYHIVENSNNKTFNFPGMGNTKNYESDIQNGKTTPNCGAISWTQIPGVNASNQMSVMLGQAALSQMVYDLYPAAQKYACANYSGGSSVCSGVDTNSDDVSNDNINSMFNAVVNYVNAVYPLAQANNQHAAQLAMNWFSDAETSGWMMAGRYYWDLSQIQAYRGQVSDISTYAPPSASGYDAATSQNATLKDFMSGNGKDDAWKSYLTGAMVQLTNYSKASGAGSTGPQYPEVSKDAGNKVLSILLGGLLGDLISLFALFGVHGGAMGMGPDPIMFLHQVGMKCIALAGDIWLQLAVALGLLATVTMVCTGTLNLYQPIQAISDWLKPPLMMLATALLGVGVLLGYYVPLYPFILFTFGVISWIISVIEAMVAAPLVAFGLTHPEGHDFLGEAKQAAMLLLGIFLRPVLMVIGLISGMILSYVSLRILVYTYSGFLQDVFYQVGPTPGSSGSVLAGATMALANAVLSAGSLGGLIMSLFVFPLMLAVFATLVYVVTNQCFSLIYVLPDYILRWIGGPTQPSMVADMARQVQGSISGMAQTAGEATNKGMQAKLEENIRKEQSGQGANNEGTKTNTQVQ